MEGGDGSGADDEVVEELDADRGEKVDESFGEAFIVGTGHGAA